MKTYWSVVLSAAALALGCSSSEDSPGDSNGALGTADANASASSPNAPGSGTGSQTVPGQNTVPTTTPPAPTTKPMPTVSTTPAASTSQSPVAPIPTAPISLPANPPPTASSATSPTATSSSPETPSPTGTGGGPSAPDTTGPDTEIGGSMNAAAGAGGMGSDSPSGGVDGFDPCADANPCKILPLGDSITWGINYGGGYRIKLFIHATNDSKKITFVGYDQGNPPDSGVLNVLGDAKADWVPNHEGHSGWTIQQDDDLVTGSSTANNDGVNYSGKKVVADFNPNIVLVHLGTNDMYQTPAGAPDRLGTLIDHVVTDAPDALVVVSSIIPFPSGASAVDTFNQAVPGVVKERTDAGKHVIYVDMFAALTTSDLGSDQVHPNEGGYEKMAVVWYDAIKAYLH
ncbi:MAG TPA: GDSL-type esterase/lipase family protein [Polyangiaceae bacterium]|nr:GDSL-type esterase/lipase family protein [Polyangiaceae bacterium]